MFRGLTQMRGVQNHNVFKDELMATCVSAIRGKVKELQGFYFFRHVHTEDSYRFPHVYDWLTDPEWFPSYQIFHDRLVEELIRTDRISVTEAHAAIKHAFWLYLAHVVTVAWQREQTPRRRREPLRFRRIIKRIPGMQPAWRKLRALIQRSRDEWSLPALLRPSSPYHADFLPIYEVITSQPATPPHDGCREEQEGGRVLAASGVHG